MVTLNWFAIFSSHTHTLSLSQGSTVLALYTLNIKRLICIFHTPKRRQVTLESERVKAAKKTLWPESAKQTIPTEQPPLVSEIRANFCGQKVPRGQSDGFVRPYSRFSRPGKSCKGRNNSLQLYIHIAELMTALCMFYS
jgi:hypothetical protein